MRLHADAINTLLGALSVSQLIQALKNAFLLEVDRNGPAGLGHAEPFRDAVNRDDLPGAQEDRAADGHLPHRAAAPYRHGIGRFDVALQGGLPAGRENVAQEEGLLVRERIRDFDMRGVRERYAQVLSLA